jgi:hypothetical protein
MSKYRHAIVTGYVLRHSTYRVTPHSRTVLLKDVKRHIGSVTSLMLLKLYHT